MTLREDVPFVMAGGKWLGSPPAAESAFQPHPRRERLQGGGGGRGTSPGGGGGIVLPRVPVRRSGHNTALRKPALRSSRRASAPGERARGPRAVPGQGSGCGKHPGGVSDPRQPPRTAGPAAGAARWGRAAPGARMLASPARPPAAPGIRTSGAGEALGREPYAAAELGELSFAAPSSLPPPPRQPRGKQNKEEAESLCWGLTGAARPSSARWG